MSEDEIYDAIDTSLSLKSGDLKKIPLQKVTQMIEKKREEEDPYLEGKRIFQILVPDTKVSPF